MKALTVKALDNFDALKAGHLYELRQPGGQRMVVLVDITEGASASLVSLYPHQVQQARIAGKLVDYDDTQSAQMQSAVASAICAHLPSKFIY